MQQAVSPSTDGRPSRSVLMDLSIPLETILKSAGTTALHNGLQLWTEIKHRGFERSRATVYRWTAARKERPPTAPPNSGWQPPSRRNRGLLLSEDPTSLDEQTERFLCHLYEHAPQLAIAGELARGFAALIHGDDDAGLEQWIADSADSELAFSYSRHRP
ncbi:hypothetical protein [Mesorhizobium sp. M0859]|uniref:hypothetical protein n=1 Tax=Mesorhizobium sp. M0859 TaxID=2957014 RepID=UPI00333D85C8